MINARDAAMTVPNPLFRPLHMVAPVGQYSLVRNLRTTWRNNTYYNQYDASRLPAVNSSTTTTVMTAHIAFFPTPLNSGSSIYKSETSVRAVPTLRAWMALLWSCRPILHAYAHHEAGILVIFFTLSGSISKLFLLLLGSAAQAILAAWVSRWMLRFLGRRQCYQP